MSTRNPDDEEFREIKAGKSRGLQAGNRNYDQLTTGEDAFKEIVI